MKETMIGEMVVLINLRLIDGMINNVLSKFAASCKTSTCEDDI